MRVKPTLQFFWLGLLGCVLGGLGHVCLGRNLLVNALGLQGRTLFLTLRVYVLISGGILRGLDSVPNARKWLLLADRPLNALRSVRHAEDALMGS